MKYEPDNVFVFVWFLSTFVGIIALACYYGIRQDWIAFVLGGAAVYMLGCIKINGKSIHG